MFVKPLTLLFSNVFACFSILLCCKSLTSKCCKRWKRSKESLPVRLSVQTHDRTHLWSSTPRSSASMYTGDPRVALGHLILGCTVGYWSSWVRLSAHLAIKRTEHPAIKRSPYDQAHLLFLDNIYFPINRTSCVIF